MEKVNSVNKVSVKGQEGMTDGIANIIAFIFCTRVVKGNATSSTEVTEKRGRRNVFFRDNFLVTKTKNGQRQNIID